MAVLEGHKRGRGGISRIRGASHHSVGTGFQEHPLHPSCRKFWRHVNTPQALKKRQGSCNTNSTEGGGGTAKDSEDTNRNGLILSLSRLTNLGPAAMQGFSNIYSEKIVSLLYFPYKLYHSTPPEYEISGDQFQNSVPVGDSKITYS